MLTYTFTKREKALLLVLALVVVAIVWFVFVYQNTTNRLIAIEGELATNQSLVTTAETQVAQQAQMESSIEQHKANGDKPTLMPAYNNLKSLMNELNTIMAAAETYSLAFDELTQDEQNHVLRGVRIDYSTANYKAAEKIVNSLAGGKYPCRIDSVTIANSTSENSGSRSSTTKGSTNASAHVTFFEELLDGATVPASKQQ